jgi:hypothetical protein
MTLDSVQQKEPGLDERFAEHNAQFAYHLERVAQKFKYEISPENAELLLELLGPTWLATR